MNWSVRAEMSIYESQRKYIERRFGDAHVNYGWGVDASRDYVQVSSKVYTIGILTTTMRRGKRAVHSFEEFA